MACVALPAIIAAGTSIAGAAGAFSPGTPAQPNLGAMTADQLNALIAATPANYANQAAYNPRFAALQSTVAWQNLFGTPAGTAQTTTPAAQAGWYDASGKYLGPSSMFSTQPTYGPLTGSNGTRQNAGGRVMLAPANPPPAGAVLYQQGQAIPTTVTTPAAPGELTTAAAAQPALLALQTQGRAQDIADVANLGPAAYQAMAGYNPAVTGLYNAMGAQAQELVNQNGALDPFTQAALQQNFRAGEASRGMAGGTQDAAMEAYYLNATQEQRRLANLGVAGQVAGQTSGYFGDPFQQVLARTSGGVQAPGVAYTANQPSATADTANLLNPGFTNLQGQGYQAGLNSSIAGYNAQMQGLGQLGNATSGLLNGVSQLNNYFGSPGGSTSANTWLAGTAGY